MNTSSIGHAGQKISLISTSIKSMPQVLFLSHFPEFPNNFSYCRVSSPQYNEIPPVAYTDILRSRIVSHCRKCQWKKQIMLCSIHCYATKDIYVSRRDVYITKAQKVLRVRIEHHRLLRHKIQTGTRNSTIITEKFSQSSIVPIFFIKLVSYFVIHPSNALSATLWILLFHTRVHCLEISPLPYSNFFLFYFLRIAVVSQLPWHLLIETLLLLVDENYFKGFIRSNSSDTR